jgi:hypothetical protein
MNAQPLASASARIAVVPFEGWANNLLIANGCVTLIITLDVGPRILSYTTTGGINPLRIAPEQAGRSGEATWQIRGGHRLWIAPEDRTVSYFPDNAPVAWEQTGPLQVRLTPPPETPTGFQKQLEVGLDPTGTRVTLIHRVTRLARTAADCAIWALTVMAPGGTAIMPQPALGEHPRDLLPNRRLVLWPYTNLGDPRWRFGPRFLRLRQDPALGPAKLGLADALGWCAYLYEGACFLKTYGWDPAAAYPDGGCNFETFTNARMLELESLGPLTRLPHGQSLEHRECWELHPAPPAAAALPDEELAAYFASLRPGGAAPA